MHMMTERYRKADVGTPAARRSCMPGGAFADEPGCSSCYVLLVRDQCPVSSPCPCQVHPGVVRGARAAVGL